MPYTFKYSQPDAYHFCQDSILFPEFVAKQESTNLSVHSRVLDLCAGCGVVGFELKYYVPIIQQLEFLEIQPEFFEHFEQNKALTGSLSAQWLPINYAKLCSHEFADRYDLIVSNPPYFFKSDGKLSPSRLQNRCRFFIDSDFETLIEGTYNALKPLGRGYLLLKDGRQHGRKALRDIQFILTGRADINVVTTIRGTDVICLTKAVVER